MVEKMINSTIFGLWVTKKNKVPKQNDVYINFFLLIFLKKTKNCLKLMVIGL